MVLYAHSTFAELNVCEHKQIQNLLKPQGFTIRNFFR